MAKLCCFTLCFMVLFSVCFSDDNNAEDICLLPPDTGVCRAYFTRYAYDPKEGCQSFIYGGCQGNGNNFESKEECEMTCGSVGRQQ